MPADIEIQGVEKLTRLSRALKEAGDKDLRRELSRSIQRATKPMKAAVASAVLDQMPSRNGLNRRLAKRKLSTRARAGRDPGVRIVGKDLGQLERGVVRHPVFGNKRVWVNQKVRSGVISGALERSAPTAREEIERAVDRIADALERKVN